MLRRSLSILCVMAVVAGCVTTDTDKWASTNSTRIVLEAEQFEGFRPRVHSKSQYCGEAEKAYWVASAGFVEIVLTRANAGCAILDSNRSVEGLINNWRMLRQGNAVQERPSIRVTALGAPGWIHFLRRKGKPCILFRIETGDSGGSFDQSTQTIMGYFCSQSPSPEITSSEARDFVASIRILSKPAPSKPTT